MIKLKRFTGLTLYSLFCSIAALAAFFYLWLPFHTEKLRGRIIDQRHRIIKLEQHTAALQRQLQLIALEDGLAERAAQIVQEANVARDTANARVCTADPEQLQQETTRLEQMRKMMRRFKEEVDRAHDDMKDWHWN